MASFNNFFKFIEMVLATAKKDFADTAKGIDRVGLRAQVPLTDKIRWKAKWTVLKYADEAAY
ncbi:MAG: hypothetical protein WC231_05415, partial [Dehalococcoidales bacterium]